MGAEIGAKVAADFPLFSKLIPEFYSGDAAFLSNQHGYDLGVHLPPHSQRRALLPYSQTFFLSQKEMRNISSKESRCCAAHFFDGPRKRAKMLSCNTQNSEFLSQRGKTIMTRQKKKTERSLSF